MPVRDREAERCSGQGGAGVRTVTVQLTATDEFTEVVGCRVDVGDVLLAFATALAVACPLVQVVGIDSRRHQSLPACLGCAT